MFIPVNPDQNEWISFGVLDGMLYSKELWALAVYYNDVWVGTRNNGIFHLNYGRSIQYPEIQWTVTNQGNEDDLHSNDILDIAIDGFGNPWVGAVSGPIFRYGTQWYVPWEDPEDQLKSKINCITIDAYNNKYYGTADKGIIIAIGDTLSWFYFNTLNSPLPSNLIRSIKINPYTNQLYVGTDKGLVIISDPHLISSQTLDSITVYPNPCRFHDYIDLEINFSKLTPYSKLYIFTLDGELIRSLATQSGNIGHISWDGKNEKGKLVNCGVYIYQIIDQNQQVKSGKLIIK